MTDEINGLLALAREDLETARRDLAAGAFRHAVSRAYYGAFHAASAALLHRGHRPKSHGGVHRMLSDLFVREGPLGREQGRAYTRLMQLRYDADYEVGRIIPQEDAERSVRDAAALVDDLAVWVEAQ
ncbi:HEPN domain-containing protein [Rubrivirga sp. S365]|uniref:HEPN domain-containing protein n=1 Tax=Rubrivirga sp. S365 TaxID=3076080 RepID=UPI0028C879E1|nr:HEPN domain-containing protein [Rubrivirga sp. S365]MDT7855151.1 HEPN domain-containing protein [Rubrivirga sp. S365]